ncbi:hypothetical protein GUJ93_ZPchr0009g894 [Zizania palustris]|uniref:Uncharacterized protein n=1 Tax=Zizania palustris TaxID=103762 RepID=A0A8J5RGB7_ZIZPA|nr:hypothetical protein GUJ93_ZPchr0009g894 [Zizania palustris]
MSTPALVVQLDHTFAIVVPLPPLPPSQVVDIHLAQDPTIVAPPEIIYIRDDEDEMMDINDSTAIVGAMDLDDGLLDEPKQEEEPEFEEEPEIEEDPYEVEYYEDME